MTDLYGYDAAYQPSLAAVKSAGGIAVNGYLTGQYATTTSSPAHALAAGLGWWATYEEGPSELVWASRDVGRAVGQKILTAFKALRDDKGQPLPLDGSLAVYPSVDVSVTDPTACDMAFTGIRDVLEGRLSVRYYGQGSIGDHLTRAGLLDGPFWLAAPSSWPGFNVADPNICLVQLVGTNVPSTDRNHLVTQPSALGALWPTGSPYGGNMPTPEDYAAAVWAHALTLPQSAPLQPVTAAASAFQVNASDYAHDAKAEVAALSAKIDALAAQVAKLQTAGVDPVAVAQAIATHVKLAAQ